MNELNNLLDSQNYPINELNFFNVSLSFDTLNTIVNLVSQSIQDLQKRKLWLEKNGKPYDWIIQKELKLKELYFDFDSYRSKLNFKRQEYKKQSLDKGTKEIF